MLLADGKLYVTSMEGETFVLPAGRKFQVLARNKVDEPIYAAPAVADGEIFLRSYKHPVLHQESEVNLNLRARRKDRVGRA